MSSERVAQAVETIDTMPSGVVATGIAVEVYMEHYAAHFYEWAEGMLIKTAPAGLRHDELIRYLVRLLETFFELRPIGRIVLAPFVMKLERRREPDLQVILNASLDRLTDTYMEGPADICIEVVSPESVQRDHGEKFREY